MKEKFVMAIMVLLFIIVIISGCSPQPHQGGRNIDPSIRPQRFNNLSQRFNNLSEDQMKEMLDQRQKIAQDACTGKSEGDICMLQSPRGEMEGICTLIENNLLCEMDRTAWQR
jgi:hypothetical protein